MLPFQVLAFPPSSVFPRPPSLPLWTTAPVLLTPLQLTVLTPPCATPPRGFYLLLVSWCASHCAQTMLQAAWRLGMLGE